MIGNITMVRVGSSRPPSYDFTTLRNPPAYQDINNYKYYPELFQGNIQFYDIVPTEDTEEKVSHQLETITEVHNNKSNYAENTQVKRLLTPQLQRHNIEFHGIVPTEITSATTIEMQPSNNDINTSTEILIHKDKKDKSSGPIIIFLFIALLLCVILFFGKLAMVW